MKVLAIESLYCGIENRRLATMAAIIAQMTRANRERQKRKKNQIVISKCMYEINEYPEKFVPEVWSRNNGLPRIFEEHFVD